MFRQVKACGFEFVAVQAQPSQKRAHGEFFVVGLNFVVNRAVSFLREGNQRGTKLNGGLDFARVERRVENPKFDRAFGEERVQVGNRACRPCASRKSAAREYTSNRSRHESSRTPQSRYGL